MLIVTEREIFVLLHYDTYYEDLGDLIENYEIEAISNDLDEIRTIARTIDDYGELLVAVVPIGTYLDKYIHEYIDYDIIV